MQEPRTMSNTHSTLQLRDRVRVEYIANHAIRLALEEATLGAAGHDAARVLTAMLKEGEAFADLRSGIDRRVV